MATCIITRKKKAQAQPLLSGFNAAYDNNMAYVYKQPKEAEEWIARHGEVGYSYQIWENIGGHELIANSRQLAPE